MIYIFDFKSYKDYLKKICHLQRGNLSRLAEAAGVQKSYLSACLNGKNNISHDQAYGISLHLKLSENEQEYLFLLLEKSHAATPQLQKHLIAKIKQISEEAQKIKSQLNDTKIITNKNDDLSEYYLNWFYSAIHSLTSIKKFQTVETISSRLGIPPHLTDFFLKKLVLLKLIKKEGIYYRWNSSNIHLEETNPLLISYHSSWRLRATEDCAKMQSSSFHYTSTQSLSVSDFEILKKKIGNFIKDFNKTSDPSIPEESFCLNIDFFKI